MIRSGRPVSLRALIEGNEIIVAPGVSIQYQHYYVKTLALKQYIYQALR
jgi:hypothetical protein